MIVRSSISSWLIPLSTIALLLIFYFWLFSAGTFRWSTHSAHVNYNGQLAEGFAEGHTYYPITVPDWVNRLPDPYDRNAHTPFSRTGTYDMSLFKGRMYSYWGPVPALLILLATTVAHVPSKTFNDADLGAFFITGLLLISAAFILRIRRRLFPEQSIWTAALCITVTAMAAPMLCMLDRPSVYEDAIAGCQFFLIAGLLCAFIGVDEKPRLFWLTCGALCWSLALGCRVSFAPAVATIALLTLWRVRRRSISASLCIGLPLGATIASLLYYNHVRFGSYTEFGERFQLAATNQHALYMNALFSRRFLFFNFLRYLFSPPGFDSHFPFIDFPVYIHTASKFFDLPPTYGFETMIGAVWCLPFLRYTFTTVKVKAADSGGLTRWLCMVLAAAGLIGIAPSLFMPGSTMRYLNDAGPSLCILATIGVFKKISLTTARRRKHTYFDLSCFCIATILVGFLISIEGYNNHILFANPALWHKLHAIHL